MGKRTIYFILTFIFLSTASFSIIADISKEKYEQIKISSEDLPEGFIFGQIPNYAKSTLKNNPWNMDRAAINKVASMVYPDGNPSTIKEMFVSIMTKPENPYGYDIVCYLILYKDKNTAKAELVKLKNFSEVNKDRTILTVKDNLAVFMFVNDTKNFHHISNLSLKMEDKLN
jgi:hypothetical protein